MIQLLQFKPKYIVSSIKLRIRWFKQLQFNCME